MAHSVILMFGIMFVFFLFVGIRAVVQIKTVGGSGGITDLVVSIAGSVGSLAGIVILTIYC